MIKSGKETEKNDQDVFPRRVEICSGDPSVLMNLKFQSSMRLMKTLDPAQAPSDAADVKKGTSTILIMKAFHKTASRIQ